MIGGTVVGISRRGDEALLNVETRHDGERSLRVREVRCDGGGSARIALGDSVWTQSQQVMWTPAGADFSGRSPRIVDGRQTYDIELPRV